MNLHRDQIRSGLERRGGDVVKILGIIFTRTLRNNEIEWNVGGGIVEKVSASDLLSIDIDNAAVIETKLEGATEQRDAGRNVECAAEIVGDEFVSGTGIETRCG